MFRNRVARFIVTIISLSVVSAHAEKLIQLKVGPGWPRAIRENKSKTALDASILYGASFDRKVAIGAGVDFLADVNTDDTLLSGNVYRRNMIEKTFMFPVSGFIALTPIPDFRIHPCISGQVGFNTVYFSHKDNSIESADTAKDYDEDGFYIGFFWQIAADAIFSLSENIGLFAGLEYQWSEPKKVNKDSDDQFTKRNMSGISIRMGLRIVY